MAKKVTLALNVWLEKEAGASKTWWCRYGLKNSSYSKYLKSVSYQWEYKTAAEKTYNGGTSQNYSAPDNATYVRCKATSVTKNGKRAKGGSYYSSWTKVTSGGGLPATPSSPSVKIIDGTKLQLSISVSDASTDYIVFEVSGKSASDLYDTSYNVVSSLGGTSAKISSTTRPYVINYIPSTAVSSGMIYRARARAKNEQGYYSDAYSDYTLFYTAPSTVQNFTATLTENSTTQALLSWDAVATASSYEIQGMYDDSSYFDKKDPDVSLTVSDATTRYQDITAGKTLYFRIRAANENGSETEKTKYSAWSSIVSISSASKPGIPTTWSSKTSITDGSSVTLYWVHNPTDSSNEYTAQISYSIDGGAETIIDRAKPKKEIADGTTSSYELSLSTYVAGATITWKVRTLGCGTEYSDWSITRTINVYLTPTVSFTIKNTTTTTEYTEDAAIQISSYPIIIDVSSGPNTSASQKPLSYIFDIVAKDDYETENVYGEVVQVVAGENIYSAHDGVTPSESVFNYTKTLLPTDLNLESEHYYTLTVKVIMDSGLSAEVSSDIYPIFDDTDYDLDGDVYVDTDQYLASVVPFCLDEDPPEEGEEGYDTWKREDHLVSGITLSVYRREVDGTYTAIATNVENNLVECVDAHPSLDYARYRVVATDGSTGKIFFVDMADEELGCKSLLIQWDEEVTNTIDDYEDNDESEYLPNITWTGNMIELPYNIDMSESYSSRDIELVEYIGRKYPVSYYGTQLGSSASFSCSVPKDDSVTINLLRRLAIYQEDVYLREPTGTGYKAKIDISFSINHCETIVPVTIQATRVEGGM